VVDGSVPVVPVVPVGVVLGAELPVVVAPVEPDGPDGGGITGAVVTGPVVPVGPVAPLVGEAGGAVVSVPVVSLGPVSTVGSVWDCVRPGRAGEVVPVKSEAAARPNAAVLR
jgi:hypothetical protein